MIEDNIKKYLGKIQELRELERLIETELPEGLWKRYQNLKLEIPSDKSVLQKEIKDHKQTVEVDGIKFGLSKRSKTSIGKDFMLTAKDLGHLELLVDLGVVTDIKINEEQIERLEPELQAIYSNLVKKFEIPILRWPKKADL